MNTPSPESPVQRFYFLDILRGFASLAILIWHYQHFYFDNAERRPDFDKASQPGYLILQPLYDYGELAVYLFFILSGFVFFCLYAEGIARRSVSVKAFIRNRFSRLYPLHLVTLLLTCGLQSGHYQLFGAYFVYPYNDLKHFLLQLGLMSYWGFQDGHSFNGPIWSVSVEVFLYATFFVFCRFLLGKPKFLILMSLGGLAIGGIHVGAGILCFYVGGLLHRLFVHQCSSSGSGFSNGWLPAFAVLITSLVFYLSTFARSGHLKIHIACVSILPATVYFLVWLQVRFPGRGKSWAVLGDMTYASYLLHFPLQIVFHTLFILHGFFNPDAPATLIAFILFTYALAYLTYRTFELPAKIFLRGPTPPPSSASGALRPSPEAS
ncbi:Peptidoglycan/LPS O-acetylase OafA/YrhL, contains acyltransferase and SGNH-hydrolase domains [Dyadobacter soli]|uniref:Peptidoglycan/LPS O-acetylase OafA/YrhL, contains acyltransferase and SGNH-hydrolase domains n=1 Tax=Dyadobacter soli TaxID=659014 RepID=A0A1G6Z3Q0_9BACT|nr:acyltransferase [Dyadobacter soli]SDD97161.1 Peptidoglycan/LPS O-acetylase OafA/YrhL, contains acyltransferase and SGNH-hydrolase domains [Dyadobacter soli]